MQKLEIEDYVKLGRDSFSGHLFLSGGLDIDNILCDLLVKDTEFSASKVHDLTTIVRKIDTWSKTGRNYLSDKMIRLKVKLQVEAELVDDLPIPEAEQETEEKIRSWKDKGLTRAEALEKINA